MLPDKDQNKNTKNQNHVAVVVVPVLKPADKPVHTPTFCTHLTLNVKLICIQPQLLASCLCAGSQLTTTNQSKTQTVHYIYNKYLHALKN